MAGVSFEVNSYSVTLGQYIPVAHQYYTKLPVQGIIECFGNDKKDDMYEKLTIYFLPYHLSTTKPLTNIREFGGIIFVNFQDFMPYCDLLGSDDSVYAYIDVDNPELNRLFTKKIIRSKRRQIASMSDVQQKNTQRIRSRRLS